MAEKEKIKARKPEEKIICHNCGQEIKPDEPFTKEDGTYRHNYEKNEGPRSTVCEFC